MLEIDRRIYMFNVKEVWFSECPFDVKGYQSVTFNACKNKVDMPGFRRRDFTTLAIDLTRDLDEIWKNMDTSSCKRYINRARNHGVTTRINHDYEEFDAMNRAFRKDKGLPPSMVDARFMRKYGTVITAVKGDDVLCGYMLLEDKDNIRALLAASRRLQVKGPEANIIGYANRLAIWDAIRYAKEKGIKQYDMGGYYTGPEMNEQLERVNAVKARFGGKLTTNYVYEKNYSRIYRISEKLYEIGVSRLYNRQAGAA